jgi:hypothetical protein
MAFTFFKRKRVGKRNHLNLSKSGVSVSRRQGPVTLSSRGRGSVRLGKLGSYRFKL